MNSNQPLTILVLTILTPEFWRDFWQNLTKDSLRSLVNIAGVLIAYLLIRAILLRLVDGVLTGLMAHEQHLGASEGRTGRLQTLRGLIRSVINYVLFFVFGVLFLRAIGFDIMPFITTAGVIGLAIGFGAQKLVKDVISGFFIIIDNLFVVGETVKIGDITGQVCEMGMRVTRIQDASGRLYLVANGDIGTVTNLSRHPVEDFIEVNLAATADLNKAIQTVDEVGKHLYAESEHRLKAAPHFIGVTAFSAASVTLRISVVSDPTDLSVEQMRVRSATREAFLAATIPLA